MLKSTTDCGACELGHIRAKSYTASCSIDSLAQIRSSMIVNQDFGVKLQLYQGFKYVICLFVLKAHFLFYAHNHSLSCIIECHIVDSWWHSEDDSDHERRKGRPVG